MDDYWHAISIKHQDKVRNLARKHGVTVERAFRNIVRHLGWEMRQISGRTYFDGFMTGRRIEVMIDLIYR
jgi:hypothetical protein